MIFSRRSGTKPVIATQTPNDFPDFDQSVEDYLSIADLGPSSEWDNQRKTTSGSDNAPDDAANI